MINDMWKLTNLPKNRKSIQLKKVFRTKMDVSSVIVRYKVQLVAKEYCQAVKVNSNEIFAPTAKFITI